MSNSSSFELPHSRRGSNSPLVSADDAPFSGAKRSPNGVADDAAARSINICLQLEARGLPNLDIRGKSDPFAVLYKQVPSAATPAESWLCIDRTETVYNNLSPKWSTTFSIDYHFGSNTLLKFELYDRDSRSDDLSKHDFIGNVCCTVAQVVLADHQTLELPVRHPSKNTSNRGILTIRGEEQKGDLGDSVTLQFSAFSLRRGKRPFYVLSRQNNDKTFSPVVYSEVHQSYAAGNNENTFRPVCKSLARLVNGDLDRLLKIEFFDFERWGRYYHGGCVTFTLKQAKNAASNPMANKFELKKRKRKGVHVSAGTIIVKKCDISVPFSFIDYIQSGVVINTVIAIDMSSSNGNPADPTSLQYRNPANPNEYVIALRAVGGVLAAYDSTKTFPAYAFGAALPPRFEEAAHVFALTGNYLTKRVCNGIEEVIREYYVALHTVAPFQPCRYGPMLEHVIKTAKEENGRNGQIVYTILLVVTDGNFSDFADVANLICSAADLPLSIVIVGVGKSDFTDLEKLDGDSEPLCSTDGTPCARDIVQFVPFHKHRFNTHQLAREVLDEIPEQFLSYMRSRGIKPQDIQPTTPVRPHSMGPFIPNNDLTSTVSLQRTFSACSPSVLSSVPSSPAMNQQLNHTTSGAHGGYGSTHASYIPVQNKYIPHQGGAPPVRTSVGHSVGSPAVNAANAVPHAVLSPYAQMYRPSFYNASSTYSSVPYGTQVGGVPFGGQSSLYQASTSGHHVYQPR
eukprot:TRINITY_DN1011_c0_g2_i1.p2 TRINITY_DN1011_c0_g2~~TRINITY_DN1011_c0_g2_i1.p2  ORF type:complete len:739 (+),score=118.10 TRINITY_DN1011_c0_g2_i1:13322-15538(+)